MREPHIYGSQTLADIEHELIGRYPEVHFTFFQSNHEGAIVDALQSHHRKRIQRNRDQRRRLHALFLCHSRCDLYADDPCSGSAYLEHPYAGGIPPSFRYVALLRCPALRFRFQRIFARRGDAAVSPKFTIQSFRNGSAVHPDQYDV